MCCGKRGRKQIKGVDCRGVFEIAVSPTLDSELVHSVITFTFPFHAANMEVEQEESIILTGSVKTRATFMWDGSTV